MSDGERDPLSRVPAPHQVAHPSLPRIPTATFSRHPSPRLWISPPGSHPSRTLALAALGLRFEEIKIEEEKHGPLPSLWSRDSCLDWGNVHLGRERSVSFTGSQSCLPSPPPPHLGPTLMQAKEGAKGGRSRAPHSSDAAPGAGPALRSAAAWPQVAPQRWRLVLPEATRLPPARASFTGVRPGRSHRARGSERPRVGRPASRRGRPETPTAF